MKDLKRKSNDSNDLTKLTSKKNYAERLTEGFIMAEMVEDED